MIAAHATQLRWPAALSARTDGLRVVVANPDLKNLAMSWGAWVAGDWAFLIALSVLAYAQGGIGAVGIVGAARILPAALVAPWASVMADRYPRPRVLAVIHMAWAVHVLALPSPRICISRSLRSAPLLPSARRCQPRSSRR